MKDVQVFVIDVVCERECRPSLWITNELLGKLICSSAATESKGSFDKCLAGDFQISTSSDKLWFSSNMTCFTIVGV